MIRRSLLTAFACTTAILTGSGVLAQSSAEREFQKDVAAAVDLYKAGQMAEAQTALERLYKLNDRSSDVQAWLGFIYLRQNRGKDAVELLEKAAAQRSRDVEVVTNLGNAYFMVGRDDDALRRYAVAITLNGDLFEPHYNTGNIHLKRRKFADAIASYERALKLRPNEPFVLNNLGVASESSGQNAAAAGYFRRAADARPDNNTFALNAGMALMRTRQPRVAIPYLERAVKSTREPRVLLALGEAYTQTNSADALPYYEGLKETLSTNGTFWFNLGVLRSQAKNAKGAEEAYRKALEINASDLDALNNLGLLMFRQNNLEEAKVHFDRLYGLNSASTNARLNLAATCARLGEWERAAQLWREHVRARPDDLAARLDLANALLETGDVAMARFHFLQVTARDKDNVDALNGIGLIHLREAKYGQAEAAFRSAIAVDSRYVAAYTNLAITLERANRRREAIEVLERAAKIAPQDQEVKSNLQRMKSG